MEDTQLEEYFEGMARDYAPISHRLAKRRFARFNIDEVLTGLRAKLDMTDYCLLLESPAGGLNDNGGDGYFETQEIAFCVVKMCPAGDFEAEKEILSTSRRHCMQIIARILKENKFADLDINTIDYEKVGPVFKNNSFGYRYSFEALNPVVILVDAAQWSPRDDGEEE